MEIAEGAAEIEAGEVVLEGTILAYRGEDLLFSNASGPDLRLNYAGGTSLITERELVSYWYPGMIYLGFSGLLSQGRRCSMILFVQPATRSRWQVHYQLLMSRTWRMARS